MNGEAAAACNVQSVESVMLSMRRETERGPCPSLCIFSSARTPGRIRRRAALSAIEAHYQAKEAAAAASERLADLYGEAFSAPSPRPTTLASGPATGYEGSEDVGEVALFGGKVRGPAICIHYAYNFVYCALLTICTGVQGERPAVAAPRLSPGQQGRLVWQPAGHGQRIHREAGAGHQERTHHSW